MLAADADPGVWEAAAAHPRLGQEQLFRLTLDDDFLVSNVARDRDG